MNEDQLDAALRAAVRHDPARASGAFQDGGPDLLEAIMHTPDTYARPDRGEAQPDPAELELPPTPARRPPRRRRLLGLAAVAAAVTVAVAVPTFVLRGGHFHPEHQVVVTPAAPLGLKNSPNGTRVLVDETGWKVGVVEQSGDRDWEVQLSQGALELSIVASPTSQYSGFTSDRKVKASTPTVPVLGGRAPLIKEGPNDWEVIVAPHHSQILDVRGSPIDRASFVQLLTRLRWVNDQTWDAAMPANVVTPARESAVAKQMLQGVPLPPGLRAKDIPSGFTQDRYQFGTQVTGTVVCRWIELDLQARASGDRKARTRADAVMAGSHDWRVLQQMQAQGGWSSTVWEYADALTKGAQVPGGSDQVTVANSYRAAFGCDQYSAR